MQALSIFIYNDFYETNFSWGGEALFRPEFIEGLQTGKSGDGGRFFDT